MHESFEVEFQHVSVHLRRSYDHNYINCFEVLYTCILEIVLNSLVLARGSFVLLGV